MRHAARSVPQDASTARIWQLLDKRVAAALLLALPLPALATSDGECPGWLAASAVGFIVVSAHVIPQELPGFFPRLFRYFALETSR